MCKGIEKEEKMRRKTTNKKVLQAISIGLSAMIAVSSMPMEALAAENPNEDPNSPEPVVENGTVQTDVADAAQDAAQDAADAIDKAIDATNTAAGAVDNAGLNKSDTKDNNQTNQSYTEDLKDDAQNITGGDGTGDLISPTGIITADEGIVNDLDDLEIYDGAANDVVGAAKDTATDLQTTGNAVISDVNTANQNIADGIIDINSATTIQEAQNAYDALQTLVTDTNNKFNTAQTDYNRLLKEYKAQLQTLQSLETAYGLELQGAKDGAVSLSAELDGAKKKAEELKAAADAALANLNQTTQNMVEIDRLITVNNTDQGINWQKDDGLRELYKKVMLFYYLPEAGLLTQEKVAEIQESPEFDINKVIESVERKGDSNFTYHKITIDGTTYYFNYKLVSGNKTDIVIFEKRGVELLTDEELKQLSFDAFDEYTNETGQKVDVQDASVVKADSNGDGTEDVYIQTNGAGRTETVTEAGDVIATSEDGGIKEETRVVEINGNEEVAYAYDETTGELVKTVKQGATTVVYRQQKKEISVASQIILSETEAKAKLAEELAVQLSAEGVTEYDKVSAGDVTQTQEWKATGTYKPVFDGHVDLSATYDQGFDLLRTEAGIREKMESESSWRFNDALPEGQTLVGNPDYQVNDQEIQYYWEDEFWFTTPWGKDVYRPVHKSKTVYYTTNAEWHEAEWHDGKVLSFWTAERSADYRYTDGTTGNVTGTGATAAAAIADANGQIDQYKQTYSSAVDIQNRSVSDAELTVTYSAWFTYWQKAADSEAAATVEASRTTYSDAETSKLSGSIVQNKIYWDYMNKGIYDDSLMTLNQRTAEVDGKKIDLNKGLQDEIDKAKALKTKYDNLQKQAETATDAYDTALQNVNRMSEEINKLGRNTNLFAFGEIDDLSEKTLPELIEYLRELLLEYEGVPSDEVNEGETLTDETNEIKLVNSLRDLLAAASNLVETQDLLGEAEEALGDTINRLTPPAGDGEEGEEGEEDEGGTGGATDTPADTIPEGTPGLPPAFNPAPASNPEDGAQVLGATRSRSAVTRASLLEELDTAAGAEDLSDDEKQEIIDELKETVKEEKQEIVNIEEEETALADTLDKETTGWWWWLLILLFGAAAIEAYRRYQKKKAAMETSEDEQKQ